MEEKRDQDIRKFLLPKTAKVQAAMERIDELGVRVVFVEDENGLCGALSDGDIRRFLLSGGKMEEPLTEAMNPRPTFLREEGNWEAEAAHLLKEKRLGAIPILEPHSLKVSRIWREKARREEAAYSIGLPVVIMAGGKGTRLAPFTDILPKALIPVCGKSITEQIMQRFALAGCREFHLILNHKKDLIRAYFQEAALPYDLHFVEEAEFYGTGGGLCLLKGRMKDTFFLSNCDILLEAHYGEILDFHRRSGFDLTMVVARLHQEIPYGTVEMNRDGELTALREKPSFHYLVNTGFYILEPRFVERLPEAQFLPMTDAIERARAQGLRIGVYAIEEEQWLDMGQLEALREMEASLEKRYGRQV